MSCNGCCSNFLFLCGVSVCDDIQLGIKALQAGVHRLVLDYLGTDFVIEAPFNVDDDIVFPATGLNENYTYTGKLYEPDDKQVIIRKDGVEYDCISFSTKLSFTLP